MESTAANVAPFPASRIKPRAALVLTGGGARAAYQVGVVKAVRNYIETHGLTPKGVTLTAEDIREGMVAILSVYVIEPQFQGQTKGRLNNPETAGRSANWRCTPRRPKTTIVPTIAGIIMSREIVHSESREVGSRMRKFCPK